MARPTSRRPSTNERRVEAVRDALRPVKDPELGLGIVDLGLIYGIAIQDGTATIRLTLTTPGCPLDEYFRKQIIERVQALEGIEDVTVELTFDPPWGPDRMDPTVRAALGMG